MSELVYQYVKKDDDSYEESKLAQKALNKEMMAKEQMLSCLKPKQSVLDSMIYSGNGHWHNCKNESYRVSEAEKLDSTIASFCYENALAPLA